MKSKFTAVFSTSFVVPGFDGVLPAGEYDFEAELEAPAGFSSPESWKASVLIHLHPKAESPSLAQTLTISLEELERTLAKDKLSGQPLADFILEEMLADPMVRLFMKSDGVSEADMRRLHSGSCERMPISNELGDDSSHARDKRGLADRMAVETAENEGMPTPACRLRGHQQGRISMTDDPIDLDGRRSAEGQIATGIRRHALQEFEADREALRRRQEELEAQLLADPADSWPEAAVKAQYLIRLYATTADAQDARRKKLVERALGDLARLIDRETQQE